MKYAQIDENGVVVAVSNLLGTVDDPSMILVAELPELGARWNGSTFEPADEAPTLTVALGNNVVASGSPVTWTAEVRMPDDALAPITDTYYVPVFDIDGSKAALITVSLSGGQASGTITLAEPGIYTLAVDKIRPVPQSRLGSNPELIVT